MSLDPWLPEAPSCEVSAGWMSTGTAKDECMRMKKQEMRVCDLVSLDMTVLLPASILPCLGRSLRTAGLGMDQRGKYHTI